MIKRWFFGLLALGFVAANAAAQSAYVDGTDYQTFPPAVKSSQDGKVVVTEYFWYGCPHCFRFEPYAERIAAELPPGAVFEQVPSTLSPRWTEHARTYYSMQLMGVLEQTHKAFFDAIHIKRQRLTSLDTIAGFIAEAGLDEKAFRDRFFSFEVDLLLRRNGQTEERFGKVGVPKVVVNGKYLVTGSMAGSNERMLQIINFLVAKELAQQ